MQRLEIQIHEVPTLVVSDGSPEDAARRGVILFYHGFTAQKEGNLKELESLAGCGYLAIGVDNVGHGARRWPDFDACFAPGRDWEGTFLSQVRQSVMEIPGLVSALLERGWAHADRIGLAGISMGGYICYAGALRERRISVCTPILGSPTWRDPDSPHRQPEAFFPVALLSQNAAQDESVKPGYARRFHEVLRPYYESAPERATYVEFPESGHFMKELEWNQLWQNVLDWYGRWWR